MSRKHWTAYLCQYIPTQSNRHPEPEAKDLRIRTSRGSLRRRLSCVSFCLTALLFLACATHVGAQGCAQCLDSTRATPPQAQAAYRHAIYLLGGTGALLFIAGAAIIRRNR